MKLLNYTKGPWINVSGNIYGEDNTNCCVAQVRKTRWEGKHKKIVDWFNNAELIAAAPDMYEALENAEIWLGKFIADCAHLNAVSPRHCELTFKQVLKALAKARGES